MAKERGLDLVLISPKGDIPVARIIDWSKFKYEQSKKAKSTKGKNVKSKEWWFKASTNERDIEIKLKRVEESIKKGSVAKVVVRFARGTNFNDMRETMNKILEKAGEFSERSSDVASEGRNLSVMLKNKKNENKSKNT